MKMLRLVCLVLVLALVGGLELKAQLKDHWKSFKAAHNKNYDSGEEQERKEIFKKNVEKILQHNLKADLGESTHQLGLNKFADMSHEEFKQKYLGLRADLANDTSSRRTIAVHKRGKIPETLDWRTAGYVSEVKDQQECGSCWAFATTGALESHYYAAKGKKVVLSEQHLVDCSKRGNAGCDGGLPKTAYKFIIQNGGINNDYCYPYENRDGICRAKSYCNGATMTDFVEVRYKDEFDLLHAVAKGPVAVGIDAEQDGFQIYKSGIYKDFLCSQQPNHAVLVIGYGIENGKDYWLIKNSWGTDWGMHGYFKMSRNLANMCGIANMANYPVV